MVHSELLLTNITSYIHHSYQAGRREQKFKCVNQSVFIQMIQNLNIRKP